jgi:hypothetical protein
VLKGDELVGHALDHLLEPLQPGPGLHVGRARRPERAKVPPHKRGQVLAGELAVDPLIGEREARVRRERPGIVGRHHQQRQLHPHRVAERAMLELREPLGQLGAQLVERARPLLQQPPRDGQDLLRVHVAPLLEDPLHRAGQHRLERGAQRRVVRRARHVQRGAHHRAAHDAAIGERGVQLRALEALQPRPQRRERRLGLLRLQAAEPLHRLDRRQPLAREQELAGERRAVELSKRQVVRHGARQLTRTYCRVDAPSTLTVIRYRPGHDGRTPPRKRVLRTGRRQRRSRR